MMSSSKAAEVAVLFGIFLDSLCFFKYMVAAGKARGNQMLNIYLLSTLRM